MSGKSKDLTGCKGGRLRYIMMKKTLNKCQPYYHGKLQVTHYGRFI
jgi:hypothetical protein